MNYGRLVLGSVVIAASLWVVVGEQLAGASADAVVNARLSTLRAPIAGTVTLQQRALGARIVKGEDLGSLQDPSVDTIHLNDLLLDRDLAKADLARETALLDTTRDLLIALASRVESSRLARLSEVKVKLDHATRRLAVLTEGAADGTLADALLQGQDGAGLDQRLPEVALNYATERIGLLQIALHALTTGNFLGEGANDLLNLHQRVAELQIAQETHSTQRIAAAARLAAVEARIAAEQLRTNRLGEAVLTSPVNGVLWEYLSADGENLQRGQEALRFVDCDSTIVTLSVTENVYVSLVTGQSAKFRMTGGSKTYAGTVTRLAGAGAAAIYGNLAVAPSERHLERYDVALLVPALRDDPSLRCLIGRTGRVFFDTRPLDSLRRLWN